MFDLEHDDVIGHYWRGLNSLRSAQSEGEPLAKHPGVGRTIAEWLLERGLIEIVDNPRYRSFGPCYRLTALGDAVVERGQRAKPRPTRPKLRTLGSRLPILEIGPKPAKPDRKKPRR